MSKVTRDGKIVCPDCGCDSTHFCVMDPPGELKWNQTISLYFSCENCSSSWKVPSFVVILTQGGYGITYITGNGILRKGENNV